MIKIENVVVEGWVAALRGMRNPMNSWDKSDSWNLTSGFKMGEKDHELAMKLVKGGAVHAKFRRMINVTCDITAPRLWWVEADTYKVGTVCNSCSTMHKIHEKEFELDDFSHEHLSDLSLETLKNTIEVLNHYRCLYITSKPLEKITPEESKGYWWQMIQLLPQSYNQRRTIQLNYEVLSNIYTWRRMHKLDEWRDFCKWIEALPYSELITGEIKDE